jgi:hypothetical protein
LSLIINKQNKLVIRFSSKSWVIILNNYVNYFDKIYGEKFVAFKKLADIRRLTSNELNLLNLQSNKKLEASIKRSDSLANVCLATHIVYNLSLDGVSRKLSLSEQLKLFGISESSCKKEIPTYTDNFSSPSILFIIGFILGDGTLHLKLRKSDTGSIWLIPTLLLPQLKNKYNDHFFSMLEIFFNSLDIKTYINNKSKNQEIIDIINDNSLFSFSQSSSLKSKSEDLHMLRNKFITVLTIESMNSIFNRIIPLIEPYSNYLYWKLDQYNLMYSVAKLVKGKAHFTLYGFITIIEIIYSYPNKRLLPKEY